MDRVIADGFHAVIPVVPEFHFLQEYMGREFLDFRVNSGPSNLPPPTQIIPLKESGVYYPHTSVLAAKYHMLRMNYDGWQESFNFKRFPDREWELVKRLGLKGKSYNLVSNIIKTPPYSETLSIPSPDNGLENVYLTRIHGFTPFDWASVIENAANLFFVDSAFTFIAEKLKLQAKGLHLFSRTHGEGGVHSSLITLHMFRQPWKPAPVKGL